MPRINLSPGQISCPGGTKPRAFLVTPRSYRHTRLGLRDIVPSVALRTSSNAAVAQESRVRTAWGEALPADCPLQMLLRGLWKLWEMPSVSRGVPCAVMLTRRPPASRLPFPGDPPLSPRAPAAWQDRLPVPVQLSLFPWSPARSSAQL